MPKAERKKTEKARKLLSVGTKGEKSMSPAIIREKRSWVVFETFLKEFAFTKLSM